MPLKRSQRDELIDRLKQTGEIIIKTASKFSIITICNYNNYQSIDIENGQQRASKGPAKGQQRATSKECNNERIDTIVGLLNSFCGTNFKSTSASTNRHISARISEGHTDDDFKTVILYKQKEWGKNKDMRQYLRPETLFGTKFEGYLQASKTVPQKTVIDPAAQANFERNSKYMDIILATEPINDGK